MKFFWLWVALVFSPINALAQTSGMVLRTHPDSAGSASSQVMLLKADAITMDDGVIVRDWPNRVADSLASGAGGLDAGTLVGDAWYEVYAIRKSSDDTRDLILHRHKNYQIDQQQASGVSVVSLRDASARTKLAQKIQPGLSGKVEIIDIPIKRVGAPNGNFWFTIETDAGGPSGTVLARSDYAMAGGITASSPPNFNFRMIYRTPDTVASGTPLWLVMQGDFPIDGSNYIQWYSSNADDYAAGAPAVFNGANWTVNTNDMTFKFYVTQNDTAVAMPGGYDERALIGFFYSNNASPYYFDPMVFNDRIATWMVRSTGSGLENFTNSVPVVVDANYIFPHGVPVMIDVVVQGATTGAVVVSGLPEGYSRVAGNFDNAATGWIFHTNQQVFGSRISSEYGGLYVFTTAGTATAFFPTWKW